MDSFAFLIFTADAFPDMTWKGFVSSHVLELWNYVNR